MFRRFRILVLLLILFGVFAGTQLDRFYIAQWKTPLIVALYPINADGSAIGDSYIASLTKDDFADIESFFAAEALTHKLALVDPFRVTLAPELEESPPMPPQNNPSVFTVMAWSLHLRWWSWRVPPKPAGPNPRIKLFLRFHDPAKHSVLDHSTGLEKGRVGIVNLFASSRARGSNNVVIAHELLHTVGATDKYDFANTLPTYPEGFAEPFAEPRFPQRYAEVMGGRIPLTPKTAKIPDSLAEVVVGPFTAAEIGWTEP